MFEFGLKKEVKIMQFCDKNQIIVHGKCCPPPVALNTEVGV